MSTTPRPPLLSDADISKMSVTENGLAGENKYRMGRRIRDIYEAARAKDAELIQMLVNALANLRDIHEFRVGREPLTGTDELAAAEAAGFKPSEQ